MESEIIDIIGKFDCTFYREKPVDSQKTHKIKLPFKIRKSQCMDPETACESCGHDAHGFCTDENKEAVFLCLKCTMFYNKATETF